ncbi:MAG: hypothetical protein FJ363_09090 [Gemmatimonadetes bacterium]|nr:hypothetical protein [Gemmatimonadota bacterium]
MATAELFRLRRSTIVDSGLLAGFIAAFVVAGVLGFPRLYADVYTGAGNAMFRYIGTMFLAGFGGGAVGAVAGHVVASVLERLDLRLRRRHYEGEPPLPR